MKFNESFVERTLKEIQFYSLWKYVAISSLFASIPFLLLYQILNRLIIWLADSAVQLGGFDAHQSFFAIFGMIVSYSLFSAIMPIIGHVFLPILVFVQIFFLSRYLESYVNEFCDGKVNFRHSLARDTFIVLKWTALKWLIFVIIHPIFHIPIFGLALSISLSLIYFILIYGEIVIKSANLQKTIRSVVVNNGAHLFAKSILGMFLVYFLLWLISFVSIAVPPLKIPVVVLVTMLLMAGGFMACTELYDIIVKNRRTSEISG